MAGGSKRRSVAVLGAGIMGSSVALYLARQKINVTLIDQAPAPFSGASRWNEGKIHLGYIYGADPSLATARKVIPGGLVFSALVADLVGRKIEGELVTPDDDRLLVHRDSLVNSDDLFALTERLTALIGEHPDAGRYFRPVTDAPPRRLSERELAASYDTDLIKAVIEVPERSVETNRIADYFTDALAGQTGIVSRMGCRVIAVQALNNARDQLLVQVQSPVNEDKETLGPFDAVVNALWEGRKAIDATLGFDTGGSWTNRYRLSLFARASKPTDLRSSVVAVGPFGDVKNYNGTDLYLSWYNDGLMVESNDLAPPAVQLPDPRREQEIISSKLHHLARVIPQIADLAPGLTDCRLRGGWVYAAGKGNLTDRQSPLHQRSRIGVSSRQGYFSVDTGKYSTAPLMARELADAIAERFGKA